MDEGPWHLSLFPSSPMSDWVTIIKQEHVSDPWVVSMKSKVGTEGFDPSYTIVGDILYFWYHFCIGPISELRYRILEKLHDSRGGGHSGYYQTLCRVRDKFFWKGMNKFVWTYVTNCAICQQTKISATKPMGLLQPLPVPIAIWEDLNMDCHWHTNCQGKVGHCSGRRSANKVLSHGKSTGDLFHGQRGQILCAQDRAVHGILKSIVLDHDKIFLGRF